LVAKELAVRSIITSSPRGSGGLEGEVAAAGQYADSIIIESSSHPVIEVETSLRALGST
jgi:hypothetical protein